MNLSKTLLAAGAFALVGGAANAATYTYDMLLGSATQNEVSTACDDFFPTDTECSGGGSNPDNEIAYLADLMGVDFGDIELDVEYTASTDFIEFDAVTTYNPADDGLGGGTVMTNQYFFDISPDTTGWFILKFGGHPDTVTHYFFENLDDFTKLVWTDAQTADQLAQCDFGTSGTSALGACSLSHITTVVPIPAAGFLLIGALGGLVALRRRKS